MRCGFLRIYVPTLYSVVFLLYTPALAPIKIGFDAVQFGLVRFLWFFRLCQRSLHSYMKHVIVVLLKKKPYQFARTLINITGSVHRTIRNFLHITSFSRESIVPKNCLYPINVETWILNEQIF